MKKDNHLTIDEIVKLMHRFIDDAKSVYDDKNETGRTRAYATASLVILANFIESQNYRLLCAESMKEFDEMMGKMH